MSVGWAWVVCHLLVDGCLHLHFNVKHTEFNCTCLIMNLPDFAFDLGRDLLLQASVDSPSSWQRSDHQVSNLEPCLMNNQAGK